MNLPEGKKQKMLVNNRLMALNGSYIGVLWKVSIFPVIIVIHIAMTPEEMKQQISLSN